MSAEEILRSNEKQALKNNQIISHVNGKTGVLKSNKKKASIGAASFITAMLVFFGFLFTTGNVIPSAISERLIEETDVQYADAVESKKIVFQQAMREGEIPSDTKSILESEGFLVMKNEENGELFLKRDEKVITADNFINEVNGNVELYKAFNDATYSRAAYYYDDSAKKVFQEIGTTRNNYTDDISFEETMSSIMGEGSDININTVGLVEKEAINTETGEKTVYYEYEESGSDAKSRGAAINYIDSVGKKNSAASVDEATLNSADSLKVADTIAKEQKSSLFYAAFMETISKMKAGDGNNSKINEAMNYLYETRETEVVDVNTGEIIKVYGSPIESPSLYAVLSNSKVNPSAIENYSSDRVLLTVENTLNNGATGAVSGTVVSAEKNVKGSIGRYINNGSNSSDQEVLRVVEPTINSSLVNNSFDSIRGINAGEFLVEGAVNVGKSLAKASGATAGDAAAISDYARLNNKVLAMDRRVERMEKSPFDITSKNTFLGSIFYDLAIITLRNRNNSFFSGVKNFSSLITQSVASLSPQSLADASEGYLNSFGVCISLPSINAVGSPQCAEIATYDTSTLDDPFNNSGFVDFVEKNTTLSSGVRTVNKNSVLADFILYNDERKTPMGTVDGGIVESLNNKSSSVSFVSNILSMIKSSLGIGGSEERIASGAAFVNSSTNSDWQTYKYAQRYVSLARAAAALKQYSSDSTAYNNIPYFEGDQNPVTAFLESFYASNDNLVVPEIVD